MRNYMRTILIYLMFIIGTCNSIDNKVNPTTETTEQTSRKSPISVKVDEYIDTKLSGWILAPSESWDDTSYNKYRSDTSQINYISGDFNCDGKIDYSLILKDSNSNFSTFAILSLGDYYYHQELERLDSYKLKKLDFGLQALPPGPINHPSGPPPTMVECGAIQKFFTNRNSKKIYYCDKEGKSYVIQFGE
jgi:hypothetical protein